MKSVWIVVFFTIFGCKARQTDDAGLLDSSPPTIDLDCALKELGQSLRFQFAFEDIDAEVTGVQLAMAEWDEPVPGRGERTADGSYSVVFEGGVMTLDNGSIWANEKGSSDGVLTINDRNPVTTLEPVNCERAVPAATAGF